MSDIDLQTIALQTLEDFKAQEMVALPVDHLTDLTDTMVICHGTSNRHIRTLAEKVREALKPHMSVAPNLEGLEQGDWILVDCGHFMIHIMHPKRALFIV